MSIKRVKLMRGVEAERFFATPVQGEPIMTTDELKLYLGDGNKAGGFIVSADNTIAVWPDQTDATKKLSLAWWIAYFNGAEATLRLPKGTHNINNNLTIPENICIEFDRGAMFNVAATKTLTFNGEIKAGLHQIFAGSSTVLGTPKIITAYPQWFGAKGDGIADDTSAIQKTINLLSAEVYIPEGTYICTNILMRDHLRLKGANWNAVLKMHDNATTTSINGSGVDSNGVYFASVLTSVLQYTGGTAWFDNGVRAKDPNNSEYIFTDIVIENLKINGNKANNQVGDNGHNASIGGCIAIQQCSHVDVIHCALINARQDGIILGYTLHGGSDYCTIDNCYFTGNQRTNIALITGKYNTVSNCKGTIPTGGHETSAVATIDIEANWTDEINYRHTIIGNKFIGGFSIVSPLIAIQDDITVADNLFYGRLSLGNYKNTKIDNCTFIGDGTTGWLFNEAGITGGYKNSNIISGCTVKNFKKLFVDSINAKQGLTIKNCNIQVKTIGGCFYPYHVEILDNKIELLGDTDADILHSMNIYRTNSSPTYQGHFKFTGNRLFGVSQASCIVVGALGSNFTDNPAEDWEFCDNQIDVSSATNLIVNTSGHFCLCGNRINNFKPISLAGAVDDVKIFKNIINAATSTALFTITDYFNNVHIVGNITDKIIMTIVRPKYCTICNNIIKDGKIGMTFSFTSSGCGRSIVAHNTLIVDADTTITEPFTAGTGNGFVTTHNIGVNIVKYNTYTGFTNAANIAAGLTSIFDGSFA